MERRWVAIAAAVLVLASRLAHLDLLWVEEAYGMAAARALLNGSRLYADVWFDKPPVYAWFYTLCGGAPGLPLRLLDTAFVLLCGWCAWLTARALWGEREGLLAGGLMCFSLTFWIPATIMAVTPDVLFLPPVLLMVWASGRSRPWVAGLFGGVALLCNSKALALLPLAMLWAGGRWWQPALTCVLVQAASLMVLQPADYWRQVWVWGAGYSADTFIERPIREGVIRTAGWVGFHLTACIGTAWCLWRERRIPFLVWIGLSALCVAGGLRFFPRYYFAFLPAVCVVGGRGLVLLPRIWKLGAIALLLIPMVRFGPRYVTLITQGPASWSDAALMQDSRRAAEIARAAARPGDTILVWGYRPDIAVWSGLPLGTRYADSQALSGVLADRHLKQSRATFPELAAANRRALIASPPPGILVDGLGPLNPELAVSRYEDMRVWMRRYERIGETTASVVYKLKP